MPADSLTARTRNLLQRSRPFFGQFSLWALLLTCMYLVADLGHGYPDRDKDSAVSVIGLLLPESFFSDERVFELCRWAFFAVAICWFFRVGLPVTSWLTVVFYTVVASIYWENLPWFRHKYLVPNWLLIVYAMWMQFCSTEIKTSLARGDFWRSRLFPRWVYVLSVYSIALFYTFSGYSKLLACGPGWGSGLSLQIWMQLFGNQESYVTEFVLSDRRAAAILQSGALWLECLAFAALLSSRLRIAIGLGLIGLHLAIDSSFGIDFRTNILLVALFFLPIYDLKLARPLGNDLAAA